MSATTSSTPTSRRTPRWLVALVVVWGLMMAVAYIAVWRYKTTPAKVAASPSPERWPSDLGLAQKPGLTTIVMLAHPKCTCTRASISELSVLMTRLHGRAHAYVLFMTPHGAPEGWERSDTWMRAAEISGVEVIADRDGAMGARLGATASGHTVVYDPNGRLVFQGGITGARGHAGDNAGRSTIISLVDGQGQASAVREGVPSTPTFGCELADASTGASP